MAVGSSTDIGIRVFLDDAASKGLYAINSNLGSISSLARRAGADFGGMASQMVGLGIIAGVAGSFALFSLAIGAAIKDAADFQTVLIKMGRAGNLTQDQMNQLGQTLMDVGGHSIFSIEDLGNAFVVLLQRGISAQAIIQGVGQQAVYLAEATGMQAVPAAQLLASTLVAFNIPATQAAQTVDLLQFMIEHGVGPSNDLQNALSRLGSIAAVLHLSLADIVPTLDVLARSTGSYSTATSSLYYFLNQVKFGTAAYRKEIEALGLSFYDANGNFIGLNAALTELYNKLQDDSPQKAAEILGSLFNIRSSQGIGILMEQLGNVYDLTNKLKDSSDNLGVAMNRAQQAEQSAAGQWQAFRTNLQDIFTLMGGPFLAALQPVLSTLNTLSIQLRTFAQTNPQTLASFLAIGAAISGLTLIILIATSPIGILLGVMIATAAVIVGTTLAIQKVGEAWDWLSGKAQGDAQKVQAATLQASAGVDVAQMQSNFSKAEEAQRKYVQLQYDIAHTSNAVLKAEYEKEASNELGARNQANAAQVAAEKKRDADELALHKTFAGQMLLAEIAHQSDMRAAQMTGQQLHDDLAFRQKLLDQLKHANSDQEKANLEHQLTMINQRIASDNQNISRDLQDANKEQLIHDTAQRNLLASQQNFLQRFGSLIQQKGADFIVAWDSFWGKSRLDLTSAWNGIISDAGALWNRLNQAFNSTLGQLGNLLRISGQNAMGQFASGLWAGLPQVTAAISQAANNVANFLAHHSPAKMGPLADDDKWMPNMIAMFAQGIKSGAPILQQALTQATGGMYGTSGIPQMSRLNGVGGIGGVAGGAGGQLVIHNQIVLDGKVVYDDFMSRLNGQMGLNGLGRAFR